MLKYTNMPHYQIAYSSMHLMIQTSSMYCRRSEVIPIACAVGSERNVLQGDSEEPPQEDQGVPVQGHVFRVWGGHRLQVDGVREGHF